MNKLRWAGLLTTILGVILFFVLHIERYFSLASLAGDQSRLMATIHAHPFLGATVFFFLYLFFAAFPLVPHIPLSLAAGALFGLWAGTALASFASTIGATMAFLLTRHFFRERVERHYGDRIESFREGLRENGALFLFSLRMIPLFPFFLVNILMGLTHLPTRTFYLVSQVSMFPATFIFVNTGAAFGAMATQKAHLSPGTLISFALLGLFPWIARKTVRTLRDGKISKKFGKPCKFDRNIIVIGAGSAGLVTAYIAAAVKAKVTLIEASAMGGDCLNTGCVPSKALIRSAKFVHQVRKAAALGVARADISFDFKDIMARVRTVIAKVEPHDSRERYESMGVEVIQGQARITSPWTVEVDGRTLSTRSIVIAAGARPKVPDLPGLETVHWYTSDTIWSIPDLPRRLVILGGGPIGCELGQAFSRLGSFVTIVERGSRLLKKEDPDVSELLEKTLSDEGIQVLTGTRSLRAEAGADTQHLVLEKGAEESFLSFDALLLSLGRVPRTSGYGLEEVGIHLAKEGTIETNGFLQTNFPNIYACGDVAGPYQFTHTAAHQAWYASVNALFSDIKLFRPDYKAIPWCTFTDPEIARVGLCEQEAREKNFSYELTRFEFRDLDRAITDSAESGFIKILTVPGSDRIMGVTIVGERAGDLLAEFVLAMSHGLGLKKILSTVHTYPTWSESSKHAAGKWRRGHTSSTLLEWVKRYHTWQRN
ncbi:MAG: FAD-dependent oxidoreductase [Leptospirillia bacterium]